MQQNITKYNLPMRILHWSMGIAIIGLIFVGWFMVDLDNEIEYKWDLYAIHKSIGIIIFGLFFIRLLTRVFSSIPSLPNQFSKTIIYLSKIGHLLLYFFIFSVPFSGIIMSLYSGRDLAIFGYKLPIIVEKKESLASFSHESHEILAYVLLGLIAIHILATIKHVCIDKFNIIKKMV